MYCQNELVEYVIGFYISADINSDVKWIWAGVQLLNAGI